MLDTFIADLKDAVKEAKIAPSGKGSMVALYGTCASNSVSGCASGTQCCAIVASFLIFDSFSIFGAFFYRIIVICTHDDVDFNLQALENRVL